MPSLSSEPSAASHLSFADGDILIRSQDGVDFRVDMTVLRRASPFFEDAFRIGTNNHSLNDNSEPIYMIESAEVLDNILRLIYPTGNAPISNSTTNALELFKAIERLQIKTHPVDSFATNYLSTVEPSLRAWALATRFHYTQARKDAVRRFLAETGDLLLEDIRELDLVGARSLVKLMRIKRDAIHRAQRAVQSDSFVWHCLRHVNISWRLNHVSTMKSNPFDPVLRSDAVLGAIINHIGCSDCLRRFRHSTTSIPRAMVCRSISALLDSAAEVEAQDDDYVGGVDGNNRSNSPLTMPALPPPPGPLPPAVL